MCSEIMAAVPECPIGLVPFEAEGPNRPYSLPCNHDISKDALQQLLRHSGAKCPICRQQLPSSNLASYKPNYGMLAMLQMLEQREKASQQSSIPQAPSSQEQPRTEPTSTVPTSIPAPQHQPPLSPRSNPTARHLYAPQSVSMPHSQGHAEHALYPQSALTTPHSIRSDAGSLHTSPYSLYASQALVRDSQYSTMPPTAVTHASSPQTSPDSRYAVHTRDARHPTHSVSLSHTPATSHSQYAVYTPDAQGSTRSGSLPHTPEAPNTAVYAAYTPDSASESSAGHCPAPGQPSLPLYMHPSPRPQAHIPPYIAETQAANGTSAPPISQDPYSLAPPPPPDSVASTTLYAHVYALESAQSMPYTPAQASLLRFSAQSMAEYQAVSMPHYTGSQSTAHAAHEQPSATEGSNPSRPVAVRASGNGQRSRRASFDAHGSRPKPFMKTAMRFIKALHPTKEEILGIAPGRAQFLSR